VDDYRVRAAAGAVLGGRVTGRFPAERRSAPQFGRHERWGRLVKGSGCSGEFAANCPVRPIVIEGGADVGVLVLIVAAMTAVIVAMRCAPVRAGSR